MTSVWGRSTGISPKLVDIDNVPCVDATNSTPGRKTSVGKLHQYSIWQGLPGPCEDEEGENLPDRHVGRATYRGLRRAIAFEKSEIKGDQEHGE